MDCQTALEILDCVRPDSDDLDLPEMTDARAHLNSCDACQQTFAERQSFDRAVMEVAQDVDIPEGLRSSLLELAAKNVSAESGGQSADDAPSRKTSSRRRIILAAASIACALMAGTAVWWLQSQPVQYTEKRLFELLPMDLRPTVEFDGSFEVALPFAWSSDRRLRVSRELRGIDLDEDEGHDAAVAVFNYSPSRNAPIRGILAAIPASRVQPLPTAVSFAQADSQYIAKDGRRPVAAVWQERDTVYICMVLGSAADLEQIQRNLSTSAA